MESAFDEKELGLACLKVGLKLERQAAHPKIALAFANRALKIFDSTDESSLPVAKTLHLMGFASHALARLNDSLGYLNRAKKILEKLEEEGYSVHEIIPVLHAVLLQLANTKMAMGRREEALVDLRRCLELKEMALDWDRMELGEANQDLAKEYIADLNFKEALPFCLKALEIHKALLGNNSGKVAYDRRLLQVIYNGLEEHEKALEQTELSKKISKNWGLSSDMPGAVIDAGNIQIVLGKYDEAITTLKGVVPQTEKESLTRAIVLMLMAKAFCNQEKFEDSKRCLEISCGILERIETISPGQVSVGLYMEVSMVYETMNDFETAILLLKRLLARLENLRQEQHSAGSVSERIARLLLLTGKVLEAIRYLESAAERLKERFGAKYFGLGSIYYNLGVAYMELERPQSAAQMFEAAKDIMDVSLGPHHVDSIEACQNLSKAYGAMGSYPLAMEFQQRVIDAWESHGPSARDEFREAHRLLEQLKKKALGSSTDEVPTKASY
ncbi:hypothetical protein HHK36_020494 [Tetracentron sinense]|uniref:Kinesin light chain n=1 Tax=Tetracentron sinense TaxID=13715 RepID=A0A835D8E7_TETSI|nr:hypothetical protein HHK36_020494 [Tetracentron sinense]